MYTHMLQSENYIYNGAATLIQNIHFRDAKTQIEH